jgi:hypothetical protein
VDRAAGERGAAEADRAAGELAPPKSPPSKTTPVKSKFRPHQEIAVVPFRWAVMTPMTVWRELDAHLVQPPVGQFLG